MGNKKTTGKGILLFFNQVPDGTKNSCLIFVRVQPDKYSCGNPACGKEGQ